MNNFQKYRRRFSVRITLYFLLAFVTVLALILAMTNAMFRERLSEEVSLAVHQKMTLAATTLDYALADIRMLQFAMVRQNTLQHAMLRGDRQTLSDTIALKAEISRLVGRYASVRSAFLITKGGEILDPIYAVEPYRSMLLNDPQYKEVARTNAVGRFSAPSSFPLTIKNPDDATKNTITYFGNFFDTNNYTSLGVVAINLTKPSLTSDLSQIFESSFTAGYVLDDTGQVIVHTGTDLLDALPLFSTSKDQMARFEGVPYARYSIRLTNYPQWTLIGLLSYETIMAPVRNLTLMLALFSLFAVAILVYIGGTISHRVTAPLRELGNAMTELGKGRWTHIRVRRSSIEIEELLNGYNQMVYSLKELTEQVQTEQHEKQTINMDMIQQKLDLLQSQINPHFIHNTLNTMRYMAQKHGNTELNELISSFNSLLRASMSQTNTMNSLEEELQNLRHYMNIQLKRYDVDLLFDIDASPETLPVQLPKLLLQPLVENALFHGILPSGHGVIRVIARLAEGRLWLTVADNGAGMHKECLHQLLSGNLPNARGYNQIGLKNVNDRIRLFYGLTSHLVIESVEGEGTSIAFSIPTNTMDKIELG